MSKKSDNFYFDNFISSIAVSCEAAHKLKSVLINYDNADLELEMQEMHSIENRGDDKKHELVSEIVRAFITPLERDDIIELSQNIDDVTDAIDDILIQLYIRNIKHIKTQAIEFTDLIIDCCNATESLLTEFRNFKKSKKLTDLIIDINRIEEEGDNMYISFIRNLHLTSNDPIEIITWSEIYKIFEKCCDACEHVADIVETITIGNT